MANEDLLNVDASVVEAAGRDFMTAYEEAQTAMKRMRAQIGNLQSTFAGAAATAFYTKMDQLLQPMPTLVEEIGEMGRDLMTTADRIRQVQAEVKALLGD